MTTMCKLRFRVGSKTVLALKTKLAHAKTSVQHLTSIRHTLVSRYIRGVNKMILKCSVVVSALRSLFCPTKRRMKLKAKLSSYV